MGQLISGYAAHEVGSSVTSSVAMDVLPKPLFQRDEVTPPEQGGKAAHGYRITHNGWPGAGAGNRYPSRPSCV